ncbi:MAG: pilin [Betaproteobacteria bacterium]|nr:pilin [Betaproteobacteria bacterium]
MPSNTGNTLWRNDENRNRQNGRPVGRVYWRARQRTVAAGNEQRGKSSQGPWHVSPYKTGTVEFFNLNRRFPNSNEELAVTPLPENPIVQRIDVSTPDAYSRTVITITYGRWAGANNVLTMIGWAVPGGVEFSCGGAGSTLPDELRPKACKVTG